MVVCLLSQEGALGSMKRERLSKEEHELQCPEHQRYYRREALRLVHQTKLKKKETPQCDDSSVLLQPPFSAR